MNETLLGAYLSTNASANSSHEDHPLHPNLFWFEVDLIEYDFKVFNKHVKKIQSSEAAEQTYTNA